MTTPRNNRPAKSPTRHRSRSRTPGGRKPHRTSIGNFRVSAQEEDEIQVTSPCGHRMGDAFVTVIRNSSGPRPLLDTATRKGGNSDTKQTVLGRVSSAIRGNLFSNEQNRLEELERRNERLAKENTELVEENGSLRQSVNSLMRSLELKSVECNGQRAKLEQVGKNNAPPGRQSGLGDNEKLDYGPTAKLQQKIAEYEDQIRKLEVQNAQLWQRMSAQDNHIQAQTARFARELGDIRSSELIRAPKVSDSEIQGQWKALGFAVRQFVSMYLPESLDFSTVQDIAQQGDFKWLPEISKTLRYPFLCNFVLESWVWHFLCFRILDSHSNFWAGDIGRDFSMLKDRVERHLSHLEDQPTSPGAVTSQFHDWRVRSLHFISQFHAHDKNTSARLAGDMLASLRHALPHLSPQDRVNQIMYQDILAIIHKAAELDRIFRMSKAHFHVFITRVKLPLVHPPSFGFKFDPETMEYVKHMGSFPKGNSVPRVDLAVSPGIFKAGNSAGANYGSERVLAKLQAFCGLESLLAQVDGFDVKKEEHGRDEERVFIKQEREDDCDVYMLRHGA